MERNNIKILFHFFSFQFYKQRTQSIATPHSVHAFPYSLSTTFNNQNPNRRGSFDYESSRSHFRDKERDLYEQQIEFERELERHRFV